MIVYVVGTCVKFLISTIWALQHKNTQILENVLYLDPTFKMLNNTSLATHKYITIPPPPPIICVCFVCLGPQMVLVENFTRVLTT